MRGKGSGGRDGARDRRAHPPLRFGALTITPLPPPPPPQGGARRGICGGCRSGGWITGRAAVSSGYEPVGVPSGADRNGTLSPQNSAYPMTAFPKREPEAIGSEAAVAPHERLNMGPGTGPLHGRLRAIAGRCLVRLGSVYPPQPPTHPHHKDCPRGKHEIQN